MAAQPLQQTVRLGKTAAPDPAAPDPLTTAHLKPGRFPRTRRDQKPEIGPDDGLPLEIHTTPT